MALAVVDAWTACRGPLNAAIARQTHARPGEAPPSRPRAWSTCPSLRLPPLKLGKKGWESFSSWLLSVSSFDSLDTFARAPALLAMALRCYAGWLYKTGGSLYDLRHTLLEAQRRFLGLKPFAGIVWEILSRWELAEPTVHRVPLPEPLLRAIVAVTWLTGYKRFAWAAMLAYFGLGRIGEVLRTQRSDLLLPHEDLWEQGQAAYLRLGATITATRGRARIQHLKIVDPMAINLLSRAFGDLEKKEFLFPKSPAAFRYRWDKILTSLSIDRSLRLTPGGLRGGGAVKAYRDGVPISEIQWLMRMKHHVCWNFTFRRSEQ